MHYVYHDAVHKISIAAISFSFQAIYIREKCTRTVAVVVVVVVAMLVVVVVHFLIKQLVTMKQRQEITLE